MSGKKRKKKNPNRGAAQPLVRLSQCMIVKNEESNIERALGWAKDIAFEQIVVDTGSTDRTVELAEKLGAKVFHFEWIDDFAAAKNFAIDQAKGNWIAFLDADEYMPPEDAKDLMGLLRQIQGDPMLLKDFDAITCAWIQLDDDGSQKSIFQQERVFRNRPDIRYKGRIHEKLQIREMLVDAMDIRIMHTGYTEEEFAVKDKAERNIRLLRTELENRPDDPELLIYLADSLKSRRTTEDDDEAERLYLKALGSGKPIGKSNKKLAYDFLLSRYIKNPEKRDEAWQLCEEACKENPESIDYFFYMAQLLNKSERYSEAREHLRFCEDALNAPELPETRILMRSRMPMHIQFTIAAAGLLDYTEIIKYSTLVLVEDKNQKEILELFIAAMHNNKVSEDETIDFLKKLYDFNSVRDKLFVARAAKDRGAIAFARKVMSMITEDEVKEQSGR